LILFIHGFGSCGWGSKSLALRRHLGVAQVIAPDLPFHPREAIATLQRLIGRYPVRALVGSSLGGFYATWLNRGAGLPSVLINPVVHPHEKLASHLGAHRRWCDDMAFEIDNDWLDALQALQRPRLSDPERYLVLLQTADEVLDYREAAAYYRDKTLEVIQGGSHRFDDFATQLPRIAAWLAHDGPAPHDP
jgi:hypothetical protein